jgi:hypothetical protein
MQKKLVFYFLKNHLWVHPCEESCKIVILYAPNLFFTHNKQYISHHLRVSKIFN